MPVTRLCFNFIEPLCAAYKWLVGQVMQTLQVHTRQVTSVEGGTFLYFLKSIKKEKQRSTEYTSYRVINPSKASQPSRTSHKPEQLDVSREILSAQA